MTENTKNFIWKGVAPLGYVVASLVFLILGCLFFVYTCFGWFGFLFLLGILVSWEIFLFGLRFLYIQNLFYKSRSTKNLNLLEMGFIQEELEFREILQVSPQIRFFPEDSKVGLFPPVFFIRHSVEGPILFFSKRLWTKMSFSEQSLMLKDAMDFFRLPWFLFSLWNVNSCLLLIWEKALLNRNQSDRLLRVFIFLPLSWLSVLQIILQGAFSQVLLFFVWFSTGKTLKMPLATSTLSSLSTREKHLHHLTFGFMDEENFSSGVSGLDRDFWTDFIFAIFSEGASHDQFRKK